MQNQQVIEAGKRADAIIKSLANPSEQIVTEKATVDVLDEAQPVQVAAPAPTPEPVPTPAPQGNWEDRFKNLKASQDTTIHNLRQQVSQFDLVQDENANLKKQLEAAKTEPVSTPNELLKHFSEEEVASFSGYVDNKVTGLQGEVEHLQAQLKQKDEVDAKTQKESAHNSVVEAVKSHVQNYQSIDSNPAFIEWMQSVDDYGSIRYDLLMAAKHRSPPDIGRIVQFYVDFARTTAPVAAAPVEPQKQYTQQELSQVPASVPSKQVAQSQPIAHNWNQATVSEFYKNKSLGKMTAAEAKAGEESIYAALRGR